MAFLNIIKIRKNCNSLLIFKSQFDTLLTINCANDIIFLYLRFDLQTKFKNPWNI